MNWFRRRAAPPPPAPPPVPPLAANDYEARVLGLVKLIEQHEQRIAALEAWQMQGDNAYSIEQHEHRIAAVEAWQEREDSAYD